MVGVRSLPSFSSKEEKSNAEKDDIVRVELEQFITQHGQVPSQHSDLAGSRSLYKIKKIETRTFVETYLAPGCF